MKFLLVILAAMLFMGCTEQPCSKMKPYSDKAAVGFASALGCKNVGTMQDDFINYLSSHGQCTKDLMAGPIAMIVCPILVPMVVNMGLSTLPKSWDCHGNTAINTALSVACNAIPF